MQIIDVLIEINYISTKINIFIASSIRCTQKIPKLLKKIISNKDIN
jgi:hypothetical protein